MQFTFLGHGSWPPVAKNTDLAPNDHPSATNGTYRAPKGPKTDQNLDFTTFKEEIVVSPILGQKSDQSECPFGTQLIFLGQETGPQPNTCPKLASNGQGTGTYATNGPQSDPAKAPNHDLATEKTEKKIHENRDFTTNTKKLLFLPFWSGKWIKMSARQAHNVLFWTQDQRPPPQIAPI
jgi:hypothetical protein